jgi:hypothetical protein
MNFRIEEIGCYLRLLLGKVYEYHEKYISEIRNKPIIVQDLWNNI